MPDVGAGWGSGEIPFYFVLLLSARNTLCPAHESGDGIQGGTWAVPLQELQAVMLWGLWEDWGVALGAVGGLGFCHVCAEHQEAPWAGVTRGSAQCWGVVLI